MSGIATGEWDYVVIGGGLAGIIVAARLSENPACRVLLVEAGKRRYSPLLSIPAGETLLMGDPRYDWRFETGPDASLGGRTVPIPRGRLLGGSNGINGMLFVRGQRDDFDTWARDGLSGWGWDDVLPWFRRLEDWTAGANAHRGAGGPIRIELPRQREPLCDRFVAAGTELGYPLNPDYNSGDQEGFGYYQCTQRSGRRHSVYDGYLRGVRRSNLVVATGALARRLTFDGARCTGVEIGEGEDVQTVQARRQVILSAGVIGSPQLLELSGVGDPARIVAAGGRPRIANVAVGENFRDHFAARLRWRVHQKLSFNERTHGLRFAREILRYAVTRRGVLSLPIAIGFGFVRSRPEEPVPDLQYHFAPASYGPSTSRQLERTPGMTIGVYPSRPEARGSVHIVSPDPAAAPVIATAFLDHPEDVRRLVAGVRIARQIAATCAFDGLLDRELTDSGVDSDDAIRAFLRDTGSTSFHPVGTCRMGGDDSAVVDGALRVRGVEALRVIDSSVMPTLVSGNTQATTMMIAERGAALVATGRMAA